MESEQLVSIAQHLGVESLTHEVLAFIDYAKKENEGKPVIFTDAQEFPLEHRFTPGLYTRTIQIVGPCLVASRLHLTEHPFVISRGEALVWDAENGVQALMAHHIGITKPGTFRLLYVPHEVVWSTFHATDMTDPEEIKAKFTADPRVFLLHD